MTYSENLIRYGKSALAGAFMSLFGVALCGAKTKRWIYGTECQM
jgi:hypothetical protein